MRLPFPMQTSESLYDQKPEEPVIPVSSLSNNTPTAGSSFASRFEYVDNVPSAEVNSGGAHVLSHVSPPKSSSFFADFGMDSGFPKKGSSHSSKVQVRYESLDACYRTTLCHYITYTMNSG